MLEPISASYTILVLPNQSVRYLGRTEEIFLLSSWISLSSLLLALLTPLVSVQSTDLFVLTLGLYHNPLQWPQVLQLFVSILLGLDLFENDAVDQIPACVASKAYQSVVRS